MRRYVRQYDDMSCGPVAILNALKWSGYSVTNQYLPELHRVCKCDIYGTSDYNFNRVIKAFDNLKVVNPGPFLSPSIDLIDLALEHGGSFAIRYVYKYSGKVRSRHFSLCIGKRGKQYVFVNDAPKRYHKTLSYVHRKTLLKMLRFQDEDGRESNVWFLDRRS